MAGEDIQKAIDLDPVKADYYIAFGEIQLAAEKYEAAQDAFRKALRLDAANLMARLQLAYSFFQNEQYRKTILQADTLLAQDSTLAEAYGLQSQAYSALKDTSRALEVMRKASAFAPQNYDVLMAMGDLLSAARKPDALAYYRRAGNVDTTQGEPLYGMGLFYESTGRTDSAMEAYRKCISRDAYYLNAYMKLGKIYEKSTEWEKALKIYKLATEIAPRNSTVFYQRGLCYEKLGEPEKALNDYENAYSLERTNALARAAVGRLRANLSPSKK